MAKHNETGTIGEDKASEYLQQQGYTIVERNWRTKNGKLEIDIIAEKGEDMAVVEVKCRTSLQWGDPATFVSPRKIDNLAKATNEYLQTHNIEDKCLRFDIISILMDKDNHVQHLEHMENAFTPRPKYY